VIRLLLAGGPEESRQRLAEVLRDRLGVNGSDGFVLAAPPADLNVLDAALAAQGATLDALIHLGGAPEWLLDRYPRAVVEAPTTEIDDILSRLREALVAG
jgi:hypothetical protein